MIEDIAKSSKSNLRQLLAASFLAITFCPIMAFGQFSGSNGSFVGTPTVGPSSNSGSSIRGGSSSSGVTSGQGSTGNRVRSTGSNSFTSPAVSGSSTSSSEGIQSSSGILSIGDNLLSFAPSSESTSSDTAPLSLNVDSSTRLWERSYRYRSDIEIYLAEGQAFLVDEDTKTFANLGKPFGQTLDINRLAKGIQRIADTKLGETYFSGSADKVSRELISISSDSAGVISLIFSDHGSLLPDSKIGPIFNLLATSEPTFVSSKLDLKNQIGALVRLISLLPNTFTPNPDDPDSKDPTLPPIHIPKHFAPLDPINQVFDPRTGLEMPWGPLLEQAEKQEKEQEKEKRKLEEIMADMTVNVIAPDWFVKVLPKKDPHLTSTINMKRDPSGNSLAAQVLESWCTRTGDAGFVRLELERQNADILVFENFRELTKTNTKISKCLNSQGLLNAAVMHQVLAFDGAIPFTRINFEAPWTASHITASLAGLRHPELDEKTITIPYESITIEPGKKSCRCVKGNPQSWTKKLLSGWLKQKEENCLTSPGSDPRVRCAGTQVEVSPPIETKLVSLSGGAPDARSNLSDLVGDSITDQDYLCGIDHSFACVPFRNYTTLKTDDFYRFFEKICEASSIKSSLCSDFPVNRMKKYQLTGSGSLVKTIRNDLLEADGTGFFLLPLGSVLFDSRMDSSGLIKTRILETAKSDSIDLLRLKSLKIRERIHPFHVLPVLEHVSQEGRPILQSLLAEVNPYVRRLSIVVHRELLSQLAISSYLKHLTREWTPKDLKSATLVPTSQLRK